MRCAKSMVYLHSKGIIHRDLKPENLLINDVNDICICDFGGSKNQRDVHGTLTGTSLYLAPEYLAQEIEIIPPLVDIYSFGIIIWELMMEQKPFSDYLKEHAQNEYHLLYKINQEKLRPPVDGKVGEICPPELIELMQGCWESDLKKRISSFSIIFKTLKRIYKAEKGKGSD